MALVKALQQQAENCNIDYEILVADDGSDNAAVVCQNREINAIPHSHYHEMGKNHGRSWIRNWLVGQSKGEFLLFIDSDAEVCNAHFIDNYLRHVEKGAVICGGILHPEENFSPSRRLRYRYEKAMEP
ncbi:MAG: glycosyltransferase, partial [Bacteroidaceae bacterium]|nr:glycosyltransferase [Bacteroidaceae bacterium]